MRKPPLLQNRRLQSCRHRDPRPSRWQFEAINIKRPEIYSGRLLEGCLIISNNIRYHLLHHHKERKSRVFGFIFRLLRPLSDMNIIQGDNEWQMAPAGDVICTAVVTIY